MTPKNALDADLQSRVSREKMGYDSKGGSNNEKFIVIFAHRIISYLCFKINLVAISITPI